MGKRIEMEIDLDAPKAVQDAQMRQGVEGLVDAMDARDGCTLFDVGTLEESVRRTLAERGLMESCEEFLAALEKGMALLEARVVRHRAEMFYRYRDAMMQAAEQDTKFKYKVGLSLALEPRSRGQFKVGTRVSFGVGVTSAGETMVSLEEDLVDAMNKAAQGD
jgi:hypothetical protein